MQSVKGELLDLVIRPSLSVAELKQKIRDQLSQTVSRLLVNDKPLNDNLSVNESNITSGSVLRIGKGIQNLKKRRVNHKPGPTKRRCLKARQAEQQLNDLLNQMTPAEKTATLEQIAEDKNEATLECADEEELLKERTQIDEGRRKLEMMEDEGRRRLELMEDEGRRRLELVEDDSGHNIITIEEDVMTAGTSRLYAD